MDRLAPDLAVLSVLEGDVRYSQLQVMADELLRDDLVAAQSSEAQRARWRDVRERTEALLATGRDVRLHLLHYRAVLATQGLLAAGAMLEGWADAVTQHTPDSLSEVERDTVASTLAHFFTESHVREWQAAMLHIDGGPAIRAIFEAAASRRREEGGRGKVVAADQERMAITLWLQATPDVLARIHAMRTALARVADWLRSHEPMVALLRRERATSWLVRLQDALIVLGAIGDPEPAVGMVGVDRAMASIQALPASDAAIPSTPTPPGGGTAIALDLERMRRADVAGLMQLCVRWFAQNEPGSPVPYFLNRATLLMNADFQEIVRNLLPEALPHFQTLTGTGMGERP